MSTPHIDMTQLKARMRDTWMAGDFGVIAQYTTVVGEALVRRLNLKPGVTVLDVACGTGNTAIPAARDGARVTGVDIATNLLEQARKRAEQEGVNVDFREGDAEALAFPDGAFEVVITMYGAMFAPRPEKVAAELLRVCRHGGRICMANWTPDGFVGQMFSTVSRHVPPPAGLPAPILWGDEATVRERFGAGLAELKMTREMCEFHFPFSPQEVLKLFRTYFGPTQVAFSRLDEQGQAALASDLEKLWTEHNQRNDGTTLIEGEYLEVIGVRA